MTGFLGPIITPLVSGLKIPLYEQPQQFVVLPAAGPLGPKVDVTLDQVSGGDPAGPDLRREAHRLCGWGRRLFVHSHPACA